MNKIFILFFLIIGSFQVSGQVTTIMLDEKDRVTQDSTMAVTYGVYGKLAGDSLYTFKKFDFEGVLLTSGTFKDDGMTIPQGKFVYYNWITPANNATNNSFEIDGKERFIEVAGSFVDGARQGRWISFYPDGRMKQVVTYYKGMMHGAFQIFANNGKVIVSGLYQAGKKTGTWSLDGGKQEDEYLDDKLISSLRGKKLRDKQAQSKNSN